MKPLINTKPFLLLLLLIFSTLSLTAQNWRAGMHDPSSIVKCKDTYWVFGTGDGIYSMYSKDLVTWTPGPTPFTKTVFPAWINTYVKGATDGDGVAVFHGGFWAPDIIFMNNQYYLYYSCSEWGTMTSTIGCVTNKTLDPADPNYQWVDVGFLGIWSYQPGLALNAIDPSVSRGHDGRIWMVYGSFNERGIVVTELDSVTGKPKTYSNNLPGLSIAHSWTGPNTNDYAEGEGACLFYRDGYYYLVYNKGGCCAGINSSYYMVIGRATSARGPFYDKAGKALRNPGAKSGGTIVFKHDDTRGTEDRFYGPGHFGLYSENGTDYVSFHYYDPNWPYPGQPSGGPTLGLAKLVWGSDGWPSISMSFLDQGIYTIKNVNSGKVLDLQLHQAVNGRYLFQYTEDKNHPTQQWKLTPLGTGEYTFRNMGDTTLYLEATGANNDESLRVTTAYSGAINQKFRLIQSINGSVIVYPSKSDKLVEIPNAYTSDYQVKLWANTNHNCQRWTFTRFDPPVAVSQHAMNAVRLHPNPADDYLLVEGVNGQWLGIYTLDGKLVVARQTSTGTEKLAISHLPAGTYVLTLTSEGGRISEKFVKQ